MSVLETSTKGKYFLMFIVFMIGLGFALSTCSRSSGGGYSSSSNNVATVNGVEIPQSQFYKMLQQFGFDQLSPKQIKQLNLGKNIIDQLITVELFKQWGADIGLSPSKDEVAKEIKNLPYFLNERKQFDLTRYKQLLAANKLTPQQFEEDITQNLLLQKTSLISSSNPTSRESIKTHFLLKNTGSSISLLKLKPSTLKRNITISDDQLNTFLNDSKNFSLLKNLYERNKHLYVSAAQYNVHEISANFKSLEEKNKILDRFKKFKTISQSDLFSKEATLFVKQDEANHTQVEHGWLVEQNMNFPEYIKKDIVKGKKGSIIGPEINKEQITLYFISDFASAKNVSFDSAKKELAINYLRDKNTAELDRLVTTWQEKLKSLMAKGSISEIKSIAKSYEWELNENQLLNKSEKNLLGSVVSIEDLKSIQNAKVGEVLVLKSLSDVLIVKVTKQITADDKNIEEKWAKESKEFEQSLSRQFAEEQRSTLAKKLLSKSKIWKNEAFF